MRRFFQTSDSTLARLASCARQIRPGRSAEANLQPTSIVPMRTIAFLAACLAANTHDDESNPSHERDRAKDRRDRNGALLLVRNLYGTQINILLLAGEGHSSYGKTDDPNDDEDDSYDGSGFHVPSFRYVYA